MPERAAMEFIKEWWAVISFIAVGVASFVAGQERNRWRVHQVGDLVAKLSERVGHLEKMNADQSITLAEIAVELKYMRKERE